MGAKWDIGAKGRKRGYRRNHGLTLGNVGLKGDKTKGGKGAKGEQGLSGGARG